MDELEADQVQVDQAESNNSGTDKPQTGLASASLTVGGVFLSIGSILGIRSKKRKNK